MTNKTEIFKDEIAKKLHITRAVNAPVEKVWKAWTDNSLLDKWWAPKPWRAETKTMDFREGGYWLYCMVGPDGEKVWCCVSYLTILPGHNFTTTNRFSQEDGLTDPSLPAMNWIYKFEPDGTGTLVRVTISFDTDEDLEKIIAMGFKEGFSMGMNNLDELLETY